MAKRLARHSESAATTPANDEDAAVNPPDGTTETPENNEEVR